jgi:hypothetical protein
VRPRSRDGGRHDPLGPALKLVAIGAGAVVCLGVVLRPLQGWSGLLTAASFGISLAMGGALFVAIQGACGARWWIPLGRLPLVLARALPVPAAALVLCLALGLPTLYPWARAGAMGADPLLREKQLWLNPPLFLARALLVLIVWFGLIGALGRRLEDLLRDRRPERWRALGRVSVAFLIPFAVTLSVASWDWTMSLEPEWFSTMYAVYVFAGTLLAGIAAVAVLALLPSTELADTALEAGTLHDLGKLLFAFSTFWAYIWFCQYLLIWYANLPEETGHFIARLSRGWSTLFWLNPILNFVVPFTALLSVRAKRHAPTVLQVALMVLAGRWLDTYLLIAPALGPSPGLPVGALAATVAVVAAMGLSARGDSARRGARTGSARQPRAA